MRRELARLAVGVALLGAAVYCTPPWQEDRILGVEVEWPDDAPRPVRPFARAVCDAADASPDARLLDGASVIVLASAAETEGACMQPAAGCWHPNYDDPDGAGTIYIGPAGDGEQLADDVLRHELGHLARSRWLGDSDHDHADLDWWARYDSPPVCQ